VKKPQASPRLKFIYCTEFNLVIYHLNPNSLFTYFTTPDFREHFQIDTPHMKQIFLFIFSITACASFGQFQKVPLKVSESFSNSYASQDAEFLIDDNPNTRYHPTYPGYNSIIKPFRTSFLLDAYSPCIVKKIIYFDGNGDKYNCKFILVRADNGEEVDIFTFTGDRYQETVTIDLPKEKQFPASKLILETPSGGDAYPNYFQLWGTFNQHLIVTKTKSYPLKNFLGVNLHPWDIDSIIYPGKYKALIELKATLLRLYSDVPCDKDSSTGGYMLNPERRGFQFEQMFASLKRRAPWVTTHICYQGQSLPIKATWAAAGKRSHLDLPFNFDRSNPLTYTEIAKDAFVLATRGGRNKVLPDYVVTSSSNWWEPRQQMIKGGGFYDIIEGGNEWDAWWAGLDGYLSGPQLGTAWSAIYDGHKGLVKNAGVKNADKKIIVSNGGVASDRPDILFEVIDWSKNNRGYKADGSVDLPFDVYQFHCYPSSQGQYANSSGGLPPELGMVPRVKSIVQTANQYANGIPTLIGEWGYDIHPESPQNAPAYGNYTAEQSRAHLAIRAIFGFAQVGAWGAEWYRLYQDYYPHDPKGGNYVNDNNPTQFATMALLRQMDDNGGKIKRTVVGDYFKQLSRFDDFVFSEPVRNDTLRVLKFTDGHKDMFAVWAVENVTIDQETKRPVYEERKGVFNLNVKGKLYRFKDDGSGEMSVENFKGGKIVYSAKPVLVLADK
jgi:endoglucanase